MWQFIVLFSLAFCFTILTYLSPFKSQFIKQQEQSSKYILLIYLIRFVHYCTFIFSIIYPYIFEKKYDVYYLLFGILLMIHWVLLKNECILSIFEKKLLDNKYTIGSNAQCHPFIDSISRDLNRILVYLMFMSFGIVMLRFLFTLRVTLWFNFLQYRV